MILTTQSLITCTNIFKLSIMWNNMDDEIHHQVLHNSKISNQLYNKITAYVRELTYTHIYHSIIRV